MSRTQQEILADLNAFSPPRDEWRNLQDLLDELWTDGSPADAIPELLAIFERYPVDEDGCGVFWSVLHGLETLDGYERHLLCSVRHSPSEFGVLMLGRMVNSEILAIEGNSIVDTLNAVSTSASVPSHVRQTAWNFAVRGERQSKQ